MVRREVLVCVPASIVYVEFGGVKSGIWCVVFVPGWALVRSGGPQSWRGCTMQWNMVRGSRLACGRARASGVRRDWSAGPRSLRHRPHPSAAPLRTSRTRRISSPHHYAMHARRNVTLFPFVFVPFRKQWYKSTLPSLLSWTRPFQFENNSTSNLCYSMKLRFWISLYYRKWMQDTTSSLCFQTMSLTWTRKHFKSNTTTIPSENLYHDVTGHIWTVLSCTKERELSSDSRCKEMGQYLRANRTAPRIGARAVQQPARGENRSRDQYLLKSVR